MVWKVNENDKKILRILYENREGLRARNIMKWANLKQSTVYKRLKLLKDNGFLEKEFPLWKIVNGQVGFCRTLLEDSKIFELHNLGYVIKLINVPKWWNPKGTQMKNRLMRIKDYQFKPVNWGKNNSNPYIQLKNDKYVIQMYPESVIVIHRKRYYSNDPYETVMQFMNDFYDLWEWFEERMKFKFFLDGVPQMTLRGNDYNRINDWMANYVKKKIKHKILIEIGDGREVWVDLSEPFGKEANTPEIQVVLEKHTKDLVINKPMLNSELQMAIQKVTENQLMNAQNIEKHMNVLDEMSKTLKKIQESLK